MRRKKINKWQELVDTVPTLDPDYQVKMEFVMNFLASIKINGSPKSKIWMGFISIETLSYFVYTIVTKYDELHGNPDTLPPRNNGFEFTDVGDEYSI